MIKQVFSLISAAVVLAACGGGGDGGGTVTPPAVTFNADAAFASALTSGFSVSGLTGMNAGSTVPFTASLVFAPAPDAVFEGALRKSATQTATLAAPGIATQTSTAQLFFSTGPARLVGSTSSDGYIVYTSRGALPTAGTVGQSGAFADGVIFTSAAKTATSGTENIQWSIEADTATTAFACLNQVVTISAEQVTERDCFKIDSAGTILGAKIILTGPGINVVLQ
jgi:hypothetical protein